MVGINEKTCITFVVLGLLVFAASIPLYLGKIRMNPVYGFRMRRAFESEEHWYAINRYGAVTLMWWAAFIMIVGVTCLFVEPQHVPVVAKSGFLSVLIPVVLTMRYAKRL